MQIDKWTAARFRMFGWEQVAERSPGFIGQRVEVESLESGERRPSEVTDGTTDKTMFALIINSGYARNWSPIYTTGSTTVGWLGDDVGYQILSLSTDAVKLSELPRGMFAGSMAQACETTMQIVKCVEWISRNQSCHLAICPSSVYSSNGRFIIGELWFVHAFDGTPFGFSAGRSDIIFDAIPPEAKLFSAPELLTRDRDNIGAESDDYSLALLALYIFAGYIPDGSIEKAPDCSRAIQTLCPGLDNAIANELAGALSPTPSGRTISVNLKYAFADFGERLGLTISDEYVAKAR